MPYNPKEPPRLSSVVFVDTSAIAAVMNAGDQYHKEAVRGYKALVEKVGYPLKTGQLGVGHGR